MRLLGAVLAGGRASRFGGDKALAMLEGRTLLDHARDALTPHVAAVVVAGREIADRPGPGLGPLGGIAGALNVARARGFDGVLSVPADAPRLPANLLAALAAGEGPAFVATLPVCGRWPVALGPRLDAHLAAGGDRSVAGWARRVGAVALPGGPFPNINTPADLAALERG